MLIDRANLMLARMANEIKVMIGQFWMLKADKQPMKAGRSVEREASAIQNLYKIFKCECA
jgi:hypothetical protein